MFFTTTSTTTTSLASPFIITYCIAVALAFAAPSSLSSGLFTEYVYNYETQVETSSGPSSSSNGFRFTARAHLERLFGDENGQLIRLRLSEPVFYVGDDNSRQQKHTIDTIDNYQKLYDTSHHLSARVVTLSNGTALIKESYTHKDDSTTFKNIKKSILINLLPTTHHQLSQQQSPTQNHLSSSQQQATCTDDNNDAQPELFSPDSISQVKIFAKATQLPGHL